MQGVFNWRQKNTGQRVARGGEDRRGVGVEGEVVEGEVVEEGGEVTSVTIVTLGELTYHLWDIA